MRERSVKRPPARRLPRNLLFYSLLLALPLLQFCIFYVGVNLNSVLLAFKTYTGNNTYAWLGLGNFERLFENFSQLTLYRVALGNSLTLFFVGTAVGLVCGLLFSYYIYKKALFSGFFKVMLFMPSIIPSIALVLMFKQVADSALPEVLALLGMDVKGLLANPDTTFGTIIFYNVWVSFGVSVLLYVGAMEKIPESVVEAAKLDGAGYLREFVSITVPLVGIRCPRSSSSRWAASSSIRPTYTPSFRTAQRSTSLPLATTCIRRRSRPLPLPSIPCCLPSACCSP